MRVFHPDVRVPPLPTVGSGLRSAVADGDRPSPVEARVILEELREKFSEALRIFRSQGANASGNGAFFQMCNDVIFGRHEARKTPLKRGHHGWGAAGL